MSLLGSELPEPLFKITGPAVLLNCEESSLSAVLQNFQLQLLEILLLFSILCSAFVIPIRHFCTLLFYPFLKDLSWCLVFLVALSVCVTFWIISLRYSSQISNSHVNGTYFCSVTCFLSWLHVLILVFPLPP